jgi:hypothetical protein
VTDVTRGAVCYLPVRGGDCVRSPGRVKCRAAGGGLREDLRADQLAVGGRHRVREVVPRRHPVDARARAARPATDVALTPRLPCRPGASRPSRSGWSPYTPTGCARPCAHPGDMQEHVRLEQPVPADPQPERRPAQQHRIPQRRAGHVLDHVITAPPLQRLPQRAIRSGAPWRVCPGVIAENRGQGGDPCTRSKSSRSIPARHRARRRARRRRSTRTDTRGVAARRPRRRRTRPARSRRSSRRRRRR